MREIEKKNFDPDWLLKFIKNIVSVKPISGKITIEYPNGNKITIEGPTKKEG